MAAEGILPWRHLNKQDIERLIQFYDPNKGSLNALQTEGCYRLWNTLCDEDKRFSYLADEVGMGKTYQALGVVGLLHYLKQDARVIILCPGKEMQRQWSSDWHSFFQDKYCPQGMDGRLKSRRIDANGVASYESPVQPLLCERLSQFAASLIASRHSTYLLRYPSFSSPLPFSNLGEYRKDRSALVSVSELVAEFVKVMDGIGYPLDADELATALAAHGARLSLDQASPLLLNYYALCIGKLVSVFAPDLIIWDEAQYLRTDATRNGCMRTIFGRLHQNGCRHLFLSATPAHRDISDIEQLNHLLGDANNLKGNLIRVSQDGESAGDFRKSVSGWMVRRERSFGGLGKLQYRDFREDPVDMFAAGQSPLYALTFASMQKHLVRLLAGQNNRFRMGELSCNESALASIEGSMPVTRVPKEDGAGTAGGILEESSRRDAGEPIDEGFLRGLGERFKALQGIADRSLARNLPHAKVDHIVSDLARRSLDHGSCIKELVFVRRVATVDELADGLLREFQEILNRRIRELGGEDPNSYWGELPEDDDDDGDEPEDAAGTESVDLLGPAADLPYFKALSAVKGSLGRLTIYRNSLGKPETSTIRFLLVPKQDMTDDDKELWRHFLKALDVSESDYSSFEADSSRELLLRRCMAHSLRFTDILVDLDVLRRKKKLGYVSKWIEMLSAPPAALSQYFSNTRSKLRDWINHFDTIVNKCFKGSSSHNSYQQIAERIATYFRGLAPVARRSGRRTDENVVIQFKFPVSPNVLICTDVLREGVNLHLFCERVSHYGIAWNSGDLEQRIGRVERADSLFERKINVNLEHKLHVGFPFLARTLDERQVRKAIRRKRDIDQLFSIIPPKESGECDDSKEDEQAGSYSGQPFEPILPEMPQEWPPIGDDWPDSNRQTQISWDTALRNAHDLVFGLKTLDFQGFEYSACRMLGELELIAIEWEKFSGRGKSPDWNVCDRQIFDTFGHKKQWKTTRTLYIPMHRPLTREFVETFWNNINAGLSGTQADGTHHGYTYCGEWNTHIQRHAVRHPVEHGQARSQISYRCTWGTGYALASDVAALDSQNLSVESARELASEINKTLPFGAATIQNNRLMLVFSQVADSSSDTTLNAKISVNLAHWADRRQWALMKGGDDEESINNLPVAGISEMNTSEAINVLGSIRKWCEQLNQAIESEVGLPLSWRLSTFDRLIQTGTVSAASKIIPIPGTGKFQIAYSVTGLASNPDDRAVTFYLSAKPANVRVVTNDMRDTWDFLVRNVTYERWLGDDAYVEISDTCFHYAYVTHSDGKQYRDLRLTVAASELDCYGNRDQWLSFISKLASSQLLNDVFQYNAAKAKIEQFCRAT